MTEYGFFKNGNWWKIAYLNGTHAVMIGGKEPKPPGRVDFIGSYKECRAFVRREAEKNK